MTTTPTPTKTTTSLTRRQIIDQAKDLVLFHGPYTVLEFGQELFWRTNVKLSDLDLGEDPGYGMTGRTEADAEAVGTEAVKQAERVLRFLGR